METNWLAGLHIPSGLLPPVFLWVSNGVFGLALLGAARHFRWRALVAQRSSQHVYFGAIVVLLLIWGFKAGVTPGLGFHHLGATLFTLMFGWARAVVGLAVVLLASLALQAPDWPGMGVNGLTGILLPVWFSHALLLFSWRWLPHNFFVYVFVCAFFGAALAVAIGRMSATWVLYLADAYPPDVLWSESVMFMPLFMFPEGFITGLLITVFVAYRPQWVATFDDARYIHGK